VEEGQFDMSGIPRVPVREREGDITHTYWLKTADTLVSSSTLLQGPSDRKAASDPPGSEAQR